MDVVLRSRKETSVCYFGFTRRRLNLSIRSVSKKFLYKINGRWTKTGTQLFLSEIISMLQETNPEQQIILHQDNASAAVFRVVCKLIKWVWVSNKKLLQYPLSWHVSFFTFSKITNRMRGRSSGCLQNNDVDWENQRLCTKFCGKHFEKQ